MKRVLALSGSGYTIIEVMMVLLISGGLLASVAAAISGQQRRTEFATATRELESSIQDVLNDAESGVVTNGGGLTCRKFDSGATQPPIIGLAGVGGQEEGTNKDCVFLGKAIQFYTPTTSGLMNYRVMTIVGNRQTGIPPQDVTSIGAAKPTGFFQTTDTSKNTIDNTTMSDGLQVDKIVYFDTSGGSIVTSSMAFAILGSIGDGSTATNVSLSGNDGGVRLAQMNVTGSLEQDLNTGIKNINTSSLQVGGLVLCLSDGGTASGRRRSAVSVGVTLNGSTPTLTGQRTATETFFDNDVASIGCGS